MKIYFDLDREVMSEKENRFTYYSPLEHHFMDLIGRHKIDLTDCRKCRGPLIDLLKSNFKSIKFKRARTCSFRFNNRADEALFHVWSSDGIEI